MPLDVLLVTPPSSVGVYQGLSRFAAIEPPVWSGLIASFLEARGYSVEILDAEARGMDSLDTGWRIMDREPRLAVFSIYGHQPSASTQCMPGAIDVLGFMDAIRHDFGAKHVPTLALGTHPSALPKQTLNEGFDFVCQGEGPFTIHALLEALPLALEGKVTLPGLWSKKLVFPPAPAPLIEDLDEVLPGQRFGLLGDMMRYRPLYWHRWTGRREGGYGSVQTSLGCPFRCSFCCINAPFGAPSFRRWSHRTVVDQIEWLVDAGVTDIKIPDEMFVLNRVHVMNICAEIKARGLGDLLNMWAYARIDTVKDVRMLEAMREAGFRWLGIGIESASKHVRDGIEKGRFGNEEIIQACARVRAAGLFIGANYIFGLPDDTFKSMGETFELACEISAEHANFYSAMAYPGSQLHTLAREKGWRLPEEPGGPGWIGYSQHAYESMPLPTETLSYQQVLDVRDSSWLAYHSSEKYLNMLEDKFGPEAKRDMLEIIALGKPRRKHREKRP